MKFILLCLFITFNISICANILGVIPSPSHSHQIVFWPLWKELSLKGHQVTVITTDPMNNPKLVNLTEININNAYTIWEQLNLIEVSELPLWKIVFEYLDMSRILLESILSHPDVLRLVQDKTIHFDLVMIEAYHTSVYAFGPRFNCPVISISSLDASIFAYSEIGNPAHPVLHPDFMMPFKTDLTFFQRLTSYFYKMFITCFYFIVYIPNQQALITKYFGANYPPIQEIFRNYSLFFVNTNLIIHPIRPLLPNIIQIGGGTHLMDTNPLPDKLQTLLDNAKNGFIYFSLGSNVKSKHLPNGTKEEILETFKELPYTILWKFENENLPYVPKNVLISQWFPQQDVLRHPNLKLFITQGGLQSLEEAIFNHIPIIGIPVLVDQIGNIASIVSKGLGVSLDYKNISKEAFRSTIMEVIHNPSYRTKVKEMAEYMQDVPETGLNRAIWWTEYVIRHKGAPHLRNPWLDLPWYQDYLLDIFGFLIFSVLIAIYILRALLKIILKICHAMKFLIKRKEKQT